MKVQNDGIKDLEKDLKNVERRFSESQNNKGEGEVVTSPRSGARGASNDNNGVVEEEEEVDILERTLPAHLMSERDKQLKTEM